MRKKSKKPLQELKIFAAPCVISNTNKCKVICEKGMILSDMVNKERGQMDIIMMPNQMSKVKLDNLHFSKSESDVSTIYVTFSHQPVESVWQYHSPSWSPYVSLQQVAGYHCPITSMLYNVKPFLQIRVTSPLATGHHRHKGFLSRFSPSTSRSLHRQPSFI